MLVQNHHTSYAYSIKLWDILQKNNNSDNNVNRFVSFAPNYSKIPTENQNRGLRRADLYDLKEAKIEAQKIIVDEGIITNPFSNEKLISWNDFLTKYKVYFDKITSYRGEEGVSMIIAKRYIEVFID